MLKKKKHLLGEESEKETMKEEERILKEKNEKGLMMEK
jgi:hypothetical protein